VYYSLQHTSSPLFISRNMCRTHRCNLVHSFTKQTPYKSTSSAYIYREYPTWLIDWFRLAESYVSELLPLTDILFIPQFIWVWRGTAEKILTGEKEKLREKPVPVPFRPRRISRSTANSTAKNLTLSPGIEPLSPRWETSPTAGAMKKALSLRHGRA